jgi:hypothetical protein
MKATPPEYYQISWQEFVDVFDWSSFRAYLTSNYGLPVLLAALVFPLVFCLKKNPKKAVWTAAFIQFFSMGGMPEIYGGTASGYDLMLIDLYVINLICLLLLIGGAYWTIFWTDRYQIGGRVVVVLSVLFWWSGATIHPRR